jgi:hypothetical protein
VYELKKVEFVRRKMNSLVDHKGCEGNKSKNHQFYKKRRLEEKKGKEGKLIKNAVGMPFVSILKRKSM